MRLLIPTILISIISVVTSSAQSKQNNSWTTFTPQTGDFSILLPGVPKESQDHFPLSSTKIDLYGLTLSADDLTFFIIRIGDLPTTLIEQGYLNALFENAYKILLEYKTKDGQSAIIETSKNKIQLGKYPGYEYNSGCGPYKKDLEPCRNILRVYKVGKRIYMLGLAGPEIKLPDEKTNKFFSSFSLVYQ